MPRRVAYVGRPGLAAALTIATLEDAGLEVVHLRPRSTAANVAHDGGWAACVIELPLEAHRAPAEVLSFACSVADVVVVIGDDPPVGWADDRCVFVRTPCAPRFLAAVVELALRGGIAA